MDDFIREILDNDDYSLIQKITLLIDKQKYDLALHLIEQRLSNNIDISTKSGVWLKAKLAGMLIDIGSEGKIERAAIEGKDILEKDRDSFVKFIMESSIERNMGNAESALFKIEREKPNFSYKLEEIELLKKAKNHYWKAYKLLDNHNKSNQLNSIIQLLTTLSNTLSDSGRIVESLYYNDLVLSLSPVFPIANASRASHLIWLNELSQTYSINLFHQAIREYDTACKFSNKFNVPPWVSNEWEMRRKELEKQLEKLGNRYNEENMMHDLEETKNEANSHSIYRKFCLDHKLSLCEHSLYCNCIGAQTDNLTIPKPKTPIRGEFVPRMEHLLNRLKSEFSLARMLYYQSKFKSESWSVFDKEVNYTELDENESIGLCSEMLRTSFRMCFGILDKIARELCSMFDLAGDNEAIYFESFWKPKGKKGEERWRKMNEINNFPFKGLYSIACDLNSRNGEWGMFKNWRNKLEHEMFILVKDDKEIRNSYGVLEQNQNIYPIEKFRKDTFRLIQLVRSAIFNFVFCVRWEGTKKWESTKEFTDYVKSNTIELTSK